MRSTSREVRGSPAFAWQAQHLEHLSLFFCGRPSTWSTSVSFFVAGAAFGAPQSHFAWQVQHWKHLSCVLRLRGNTINTTPSTQHHPHNTIYTTSSTQQHHLRYIITYWQVQHLKHCHLTPSASFLLVPLLLFFVVVCCCSVSLTYSTLGYPKTLLTCGAIRSDNFKEANHFHLQFSSSELQKFEDSVASAKAFRWQMHFPESKRRTGGCRIRATEEKQAQSTF